MEEDGMPAGEICSAAEEHYSSSLRSLVHLNIQNGHHFRKTAIISVSCFWTYQIVLL